MKTADGDQRSNQLDSVIVVVAGTLVYLLWSGFSNAVEDFPASSGPGIYSYTCEHCGNTITDRTQDPMVTDTLQCQHCKTPLQDQRAAANIAHGYFEELEEEEK